VTNQPTGLKDLLNSDNTKIPGSNNAKKHHHPKGQNQNNYKNNDGKRPQFKANDNKKNWDTNQNNTGYNTGSGGLQKPNFKPDSRVDRSEWQTQQPTNTGNKDYGSKRPEYTYNKNKNNDELSNQKAQQEHK
jgi:hypothetical protein